ncbi:MAG: cache domain-containing protein [Oscillatoria sp. PMC 1051.18]|nr:cache domain-containing protein [Oscillatoria sp. PMC 1050.18]MEC5029722.1 cache domain-containing protein [Oscillatoria sp. PMC 1051.18]
MNEKNWQKIAFKTTRNFCLITLSLALFGALFYSWSQKRRFDAARLDAKRATVRVSLQLERELRFAQDIALAIANDLSSGRLSDEEVFARLELDIEKDPNLSDIGVAYAPYAYAEDVRLYAPSVTRVNNELQQSQLEAIYNYTRPKYLWYLNTKQRGPNWGEPYAELKNPESDDPIVGFYTPFYDSTGENKEFRGVVYTEYSLGKFQEIMNSLKLGRTGYGFILSESGIFLYHPNEEYVKSLENIFNITYEQESEDLRDNLIKALNNEPVETSLSDEVTGQSSWLFLRQIDLNGWTVGIVFIQDEILPDTLTTRRQVIWLSLAVLWCLISLSILILRAYLGNTKRLWIVSSIATLLFALEIGFIWYLALRGRNYTSTRDLLLSQTGVQQLLAPQVELSKRLNQEPPIYVPTGVFIQSLDFATSNDVFITGYIWQRYRPGIHDDLSQGFFLPDALDGNDLEIKEVYRVEENNSTVIGWYFEATIRQDFDFSYYPFDAKDVQIRIWHQDFNRQDLNRQVILVPDLISYPVINPKARPGIAEDIVLTKWNLADSFFEYEFKNYNTKFGVLNSVIKTRVPELHFTIVLQRDFIAPFISRVGPIMIVVSLLFALLLVSNDDNAMEVLGACGGFVFIVILDQITVREEIVTKGILYFEFFYFVLYFFIFLVAVLAILLLSEKKLGFVKYKNNLIPKLLFFPSIMKLLLIITILVFS